MKRVFKISAAANAELLLRHISIAKSRALPLFNYILTKNHISRFSREFCVQTTTTSTTAPQFSSLIDLFIDNFSQANFRETEELKKNVSIFRDRLIQCGEDFNSVNRVLENDGVSLIKMHDGRSTAILELLKQLDSRPNLALEVFNWRRNSEESGIPMMREEYAKGISIAGRIKNVDLAVEFFTEATNKRLLTTSTYNSLMGTYMVNGLADKCQSLFHNLKQETSFGPSAVTYNIMLSVYGRLMFIDRMEAMYKEMNDRNLSPNLGTYNTLIAGYLTAWMWDRMETTLQIMKESPIKPDTSTYCLMLKGYSYAGNLEKMEEIYDLIKHDVEDNGALIRTMICAYCKSSVTDRVKKVEALQRLIPAQEYRPWLNVLLIRLYASEDWLCEMENSINEAFKRETSVITVGVMRAIIATYFRCGAVDRLCEFVNRAKSAGWRSCRSLYHCKMVMYATKGRLEEMESVITEMEKLNLNSTKKTFWILYKAYSMWSESCKADRVRVLMCKHGYGIPLDKSASQ